MISIAIRGEDDTMWYGVILDIRVQGVKRYVCYDHHFNEDVKQLNCSIT